MGVIALFTKAPPAPPSCPASVNLGTEVYGPITNLDCAYNEDPLPEKNGVYAAGTTARMTIPAAETNWPNPPDWDVYFDVTFPSHPTLDIVYEQINVGFRNMSGDVYEWDGGPVASSGGGGTILAGVDLVLNLQIYFQNTRDVIVEISYVDAQGGDWIPFSTNMVADHYLYTVSPIPITYTELVNDSGKRGIISEIAYTSG